MSVSDPNLTVYVKLNELADVVNAQSKYIRDIDGLFRALANDKSFSGWITRRLLEQYVKRSSAPPIVGIKHVDIPPVIPGTLEIRKNGR